MVFIYSPSACVFLLSLVLVRLFTLRRRRLFVLWLLIEVRVILFIGIMASEVHQRGESKAKFFLAQVFIGIGIFFILQIGGWESLKSGSTIFIVCLILKMGVAPFHF